MNDEKIDLIDYLPKIIFTGSKECILNTGADDLYILLSYSAETSNNAKIEYSHTIPRSISKNQETFEVLGLLQAEMGKTQNGNLSFANSEPRIINEVMKWFENEFEIKKDFWKWSIKVNINEPKDIEYKKYAEQTCLYYWLEKSKLQIGSSYPKNVTYIKNTKNIKLKRNYQGTLVIEYKNNLFSQIIKNFVKNITYNKIIGEDVNYINDFRVG